MVVLFLLTILGSFLPPRLLDPNWILILSSNLIDNGVNPLLGLFLMMLASYLDPSNEAIKRRQTRFRSLACWAAIGYLLLAPLQGMAFLRGFDQASSSLTQQTQQSRQAIASLRDAVINADTLVDLQTRMLKLQAPALPPDATSVSLAALKTSLLNQLEARDNVLKQALREPLIKQLWPTLQKTLRNMAAALVLGLGFASVATAKGSSVTLLQGWIEGLRALNEQPTKLTNHWKKWAKQRSEKRTLAKKMALIRREQKKSLASKQNKKGKKTMAQRLASIRLDQKKKSANYQNKKGKRTKSKLHQYFLGLVQRLGL
ncbi:MAG: hypothetical protein WAM11_16675 [Cyanobium sp.]